VLRQRSISAIGIVLFAAIPAFIGGIVFAIALLVVAVVSLFELTSAFRVAGFAPFRWTALIAGALFVIIGAIEPLKAIPWLVIALLLLTLIIPMARPTLGGALVDWSLSFAGTVYVALPLVFAIGLRGFDGDASQGWVNDVAGWFGTSGRGLALVGMVFSVTWLNDTAAYLLGRRFGKTKLVPTISPGKTRIGSIAGLAAGALTGMLAAWVFGLPVNIAIAAVIGLLVAIAGQFGDLAESLIKRSLGVKDMGNLIPGHGGMLDRVDALLFTFPVTYALAELLTRMGWL
jgi:phosphatidate cytidylyltransferase